MNALIVRDTNMFATFTQVSNFEGIKVGFALSHT